MSTVEEIERAIEQLQPQDRVKLASWFAEKEGGAWDRQIERDAAAGKLDFLFEEADRDREAGLLRDWPPEPS